MYYVYVKGYDVSWSFNNLVEGGDGEMKLYLCGMMMKVRGRKLCEEDSSGFVFAFCSGGRFQAIPGYSKLC
jgi:hypothetical protein